ncbi:MAG: energy-coupling factor ABC transporter permease [Nitrospinae bacterium]|nr:energy-coupling factor ABC transporter permease [Nitrospinota bacterium]
MLFNGYKKKLFLIPIIPAFFPTDAHAMHIGEGILPMSWAIAWTLLALPFLYAGVRKVREREKKDFQFKPLLGLLCAAVFAVSCMPVPVPIAGTCSHPCGVAIAAIILGPVLSVFITSIALFIQAVFLAHGGLTTWGGNIVSMGIVGSFTAWMAYAGLRRLGAGILGAAFVSGLLSDWTTYAATSLELALALQGDRPVLDLFTAISLAFVPTQLPLGLLEGFVTMGMVSFLLKRKPEILAKKPRINTNIIFEKFILHGCSCKFVAKRLFFLLVSCIPNKNFLD